MDMTEIEAAATALIGARKTARVIDRWPTEWLPRDLAEAYRLQGAVVKGLGDVGGWKVAAINDEQRRTLGVPRPIGGPVMAAWMRDASERPAEFRVADFIAAKLECEFAFELAHDLPARAGRPYSRGEVQAAVASLRLAIEVVDSRLPRGLGACAELADAFNNGGFVAGPRIVDWQAIDFAATTIVLQAERDGIHGASELAHGSGAAILDGDPFATVVLLANAQPEGGAGLRAGHIVTTGSCTGAPWLPGPGVYRAEFAGLGAVEVRFTA
ncbi:MAG: hypothetical protein ABI281_02520 [Caldimonas sp.]